MSPWIDAAIGLVVFAVILLGVLHALTFKPLSKEDERCQRIDEELDYGRYSPGPRMRD